MNVRTSKQYDLNSHLIWFLKLVLIYLPIKWSYCYLIRSSEDMISFNKFVLQWYSASYSIFLTSIRNRSCKSNVRIPRMFLDQVSLHQGVDLLFFSTDVHSIFDLSNRNDFSDEILKNQLNTHLFLFWFFILCISSIKMWNRCLGPVIFGSYSSMSYSKSFDPKIWKLVLLSFFRAGCDACHPARINFWKLVLVPIDFCPHHRYRS